jgi:hypothetical protein
MVCPEGSTERLRQVTELELTRTSLLFMLKC